jgi:TonB family protein
VHIRLDLVQRLNDEVCRAIPSSGNPHAETGGLLLGSISSARGGVEITDYHPLPYTALPDGRYAILRAPDLETALSNPKNGLAVAGYYRSHLREGLQLDGEDLLAANLYFSNPAQVFLLIKPDRDAPSTAGFFFWDQKEIHSSFSFMEFPFEAALLKSKADSDKGAQDTLVEPAPPVEEIPEPPPLPARETQTRSRLGWLLPASAAALALVALLGAAFMVFRQFESRIRLEAATAPTPELGLQVQPQGGNLLVSWSRNSPYIRAARSALLVISDSGRQQQKVPLDAADLQIGKVVYTPAGDRIQFRLDVVGDGEHSEMVLAIVQGRARSGVDREPGRADRSPAGLQLNYQKPVSDSDSPANRQTELPASTIQKPGREFVPPLAGRQLNPSRQTVYLDPPEVPGTQRSPNPSPPPFQSSVAPVLPEPPPPVVEPKPEQVKFSFVNARPIRQAQPTVPVQMQRMLIHKETRMEVKVYVDARGKVTRAEVISGSSHQVLVSAVVNAALSWKFEPAQRNGVPVAAEAMIIFVFHPPSGVPGP